MSEPRDRSIHSSRIVFIVITLLVLLVLGGVIFWLKTSVPRNAEQKTESAPGERQSITGLSMVDEPFSIMLYYPSAGRLTAEPSRIRRQPDSQLQIKEALSALLAGRQSDQIPVLKNLKLNAAYIDPAGSAYIDLSASAQGKPTGSAWDEFLALYAVVNTLTQNFEEIKQVRFLIDGRESQTLAGHVDISSFFSRRLDIVKH